MRITTQQRRARLVSRHHLAGSAADAVQAALDVVVLHATDPATVYLSVLARCPDLKLSDVARTMYDERALVRMMAMRRTLFAVPQAHVPVVHHAASLGVAREMRRRLVQQLSTIRSDPPVEGDHAEWLAAVEKATVQALERRGSATAAQLSTDVPLLRTALLPDGDKRWDQRRTVTPQVLALLGAEGHIVRSQPRGSWVSRAHTWEPASSWWPAGIAPVPDAPSRLVELYLRRFGPATVADVQWWTGWTLGATRTALSALDTSEVEHDGSVALVMSDDTAVDDPAVGDPAGPTVALLPALDPTPMGWKERDWYLPPDRRPLYDRNGNIGPTVWWGGEVVGAWSVRATGEVTTSLIVDRGRTVVRAVREAAERLEPRLEGTPVVPSFPTPLEKELRSG